MSTIIDTTTTVVLYAHTTALMAQALHERGQVSSNYLILQLSNDTKQNIYMLFCVGPTAVSGEAYGNVPGNAVRAINVGRTECRTSSGTDSSGTRSIYFAEEVCPDWKLETPTVLLAHNAKYHTRYVFAITLRTEAFKSAAMTVDRPRRCRTCRRGLLETELRSLRDACCSCPPPPLLRQV